jgi:lipopolysaccharide export system protein LptA
MVPAQGGHHFRSAGRGRSTQSRTGRPRTNDSGAADTEGNEVYRLRADGNVHIFTQTDQAWGDQATDDLDQAVLVMTGNNLKLTTPTDTLTARDTVEYWSRKHMAVARGDAVVVTNDGRRISADTLVAYTIEQPAAGSGAAGSNVPPRNAPPSANPSDDPMAAMAGRLERVEAFGNVSVRTVTDNVIGDRAVYVPDTGVAHVGGNVRITHGPNQINGAEAVVNMKTGVATLLAGDTGRVTGLVIPNEQSNPLPGSGAKTRPPGDQPKPGTKP